MTFTKISTLVAVLASCSSVTAHGHVQNLVINGVWYQGYDSVNFPYQRNPPTVAGWTIEQKDNGFVSPHAYYEPDIICHRDAVPAKGHVEVAAGDTITIQWSEWPDNHHGPILDYLANCHGPCEEVDKTTLEFFKIDALGVVDRGRPGTYADDILIDNGYAWNVRIPENIAEGNYILRHEIIALHNAIEKFGAQNYPQCFNLKITGEGSDHPEGVNGMSLYDPEDEGLYINIYSNPADYKVPGPPIIEGGVTSVKQEPSSATRTASATTTY
ncbi:glycoside hydrolase [Thelonectria olida]|uniref:lytic cellulose monooxygenase (C4-dehydrogenating) n=1 Tax=Thelonectria olida TaxID=1576542 RepID=A0A9P8WA09_9HYPO|nr:glycoside hydrolase [Thelonectria olida]